MIKSQMLSAGAKAAYSYDPRTGRELWRVRYIDWSVAPRPLFDRGLAYLVTGLTKTELWAVKADGQGDVTDTQVLWKVKTHVGKYSSPILVDGLIYTAAEESFLSCLDAATGSVVWSERIGGGYQASPIYADGRLYFFNQQGSDDRAQARPHLRSAGDQHAGRRLHGFAGGGRQGVLSQNAHPPLPDRIERRREPLKSGGRVFLAFSGLFRQGGAKMKDGAKSSRRAAVATILWRLVVLACLGLPARGGAQTALEFFTNQANALLQAQFGFGVTNIPVYSSTNASAGYTAAIHYVLQAAANDYDATTSSTDFPSVFRPVFSAQSNGLWIAGYTNVTDDFDAQMARGFKQANDPTVGPDDNVWGVPWVVGAKGNPPNFNEYSYATAFTITRRIEMTRPTTNVPPSFTNQFYDMGISNIFGAEAWNSHSNVFTNSVSIIASNLVSIIFTNNYNWGTNFIFGAATNWAINSWPGWNGVTNRSSPSASLMVPLLTTVVPLPDSVWSESLAQFVPGSNYLSLPTSDFMQVAWPVHDWTLQITNQLVYALVDSSTGTNRVLDFVNLGGIGSALDMNLITNGPTSGGFPIGGSGAPLSAWLVWNTNGATDDPQTSPMSSGALAQIQISTGQLHVADWPPDVPPYELPYVLAVMSNFEANLSGRGNDLVFQAPFVPTATLWQNNSWQAATPWVHYTVEDLTDARLDLTNMVMVVVPISPAYPPPGVDYLISNSVCSIGSINPAYQPVTVSNVDFDLAGGIFSLSFIGFTNMPFAVWASGDLVNWTPAGTALQPSPGQFQFNDLAAPNYPARFYQLRLP